MILGVSPERKASCGIDENLEYEIIEEVNLKKDSLKNNDYIQLNSCNGTYKAKIIKNSGFIKGIFIRKNIDENKENEEFYWKFIELIFSTLDTHSQMEKFISMEEQNRIANEIHDTVIQKLFGMVCSLKTVENNIDNMNKEEFKDYFKMLQKSTEITMKELRESIYGRSFQKTVTAFIDAMELYMKEAENLSGASITLDIDNTANFMTPAQKISIYRVSCEAVNNAIRHGNANDIKISLYLDSENINLTIEDNGLGFKKSKESLFRGNGLKNMNAIASLLKGNLSIESDIDNITKIKLNLPR